MKSNDCTIIVSSCDAYSDIWDAFFELFEKFWPDCPYKIILNTETLAYSHSNFDIAVANAKNPDVSWTRRLKNVVEQIASEQIMFLLDDSFLYDYVDTRRVLQAVQWLKENPQIALFRFFRNLTAAETGCSKFQGFVKLAKNDNAITVSALAGVWNKNKLLNYLNHDESPWEFELFASRRSRETEDEFYFESNTGRTPIYPCNVMEFGIVSGKWFPKTKILFNENSIKMDFSVRGFFDKKDFPLTASYLTDASLDSWCLPFYDMNKKGDPTLFFSEKVNKTGHFKQEYHIPGAKKMVLWKPGMYMGFLLSKLVCTFVYEDGYSEIVNNEKLFGNFIYLDNNLVFNFFNPLVHITAERDILIESLVIEGEFIKPLTEEIMLRANELKRPGPTPEQKRYTHGIWREMLISPSRKPNKVFSPKLTYIPVIESDKEYQEGFFSVTYLIDSINGSNFKWRLSDQSWFVVENLSVEAVYSDGYSRKIGFSSVNNSFTKIKNCILFSGSETDILINLPFERPEKLIITGIIHYPIPPEILQEFIYKRANINENTSENTSENTNVNINENTNVNINENTNENYLIKRAIRGLKKYGVFGLVKEVFIRIFMKKEVK